MDRQMIELIFSHIKDLGAEGAEAFYWYLGIYYGYNIFKTIIIASVVCLIVIVVKRIFQVSIFGSKIADKIHQDALNQYGSCYNRRELEAVESFVNNAIKNHNKDK